MGTAIARRPRMINKIDSEIDGLETSFATSFALVFITRFPVTNLTYTVAGYSKPERSGTVTTTSLFEAQILIDVGSAENEALCFTP
jgi:hypothetical protein